MTSRPHVWGQPQKLCFQDCFERLNFGLNAWRHITQELVMSLVQNSRQRGNLNLSTKQRFVQSLKLRLTGNCWEEKMADASMEKKVAEMSLDQQKAWLWAFSSASMFSKAYMNISRSIKACLFAARDFSHYRICCYRRMVCEYIFWISYYLVT